MNEKEKYVLEHYEITKKGKVFSTLNCNNNYKKRELKYRTDKDGYFDITLVYNNKGNRQPFRVHRLVALKYISNPNNFPIVNHLDLDKQNNNVENLRWSIIRMNTQHGYDYSAYKNIKSVKAIEKDGKTLIFPSESHASRYYGYANPTTVNHILQGLSNNPIPRGKRKGLYFEYTNEGVTTIERNPNTVVRV